MLPRRIDPFAPGSVRFETPLESVRTLPSLPVERTRPYCVWAGTMHEALVAFRRGLPSNEGWSYFPKATGFDDRKKRTKGLCQQGLCQRVCDLLDLKNRSSVVGNLLKSDSSTTSGRLFGSVLRRVMRREEMERAFSTRALVPLRYLG
jgi:hypothetical protein